MNYTSLKTVSVLTTLSATLFAVSGCSTLQELSPFDNKRIEYKTAQSGPTLEIPPDLAPPKYDDRYRQAGTATLSGINAQNRANAILGAGGVLPAVAGVKIERAGSERWIVVNATVEDVFPRLRDFWSSQNLTLVVDSPTIGLLETDWQENRARIKEDFIRRTIGKVFDNIFSSGTRDKYRTRVERGANGTTEIYVSHRGMEEFPVSGSQNAQFRWEMRKPEPEYEAEMLNRMMQFLGLPKDVAAATAKSAVTPNPVGASGAEPAREDQATIVKAGAFTTLEMTDSFDRAWRRVGLALDRVGFTVVDRDRTQGAYFVRYADPEMIAKNEPGILDKLKFWKSESKEQVEQYRVLVKEVSGKSVVSVLDKEGNQDSSVIATRIATLLHQQLK